MLSTGIDIPPLEFIVFLRPVKSRILWEQMLGRGTRKCTDINKTHFVIFDCFGGTLIDYFKGASSFELEELVKEAIPLEQVIENIYQNIDRAYYTRVLIKRLRRIEKNMSGDAVELFAKFIPNGNLNKFTSNLAQAIKIDFNSTMALLRNKEFQELLLNYPRAKRPFIRAPEVEDVVTSEYKFRLADKYLKPADYLGNFSQFIKDNKDKIEAIKIVLNKPKAWKTSVLNDLCAELASHSFPVKELQKAHELVSHVSLADVISIVKHAAREDAPLFTAEQRVNRAMELITAGKTFNEEQQKWLGLIREHLITSLTLDEDDFRTMLVFTRRGGLGKVKQLFGEKLSSLIADVNTAVAA
jgi:type I restriction enzyme R subunit